MSKELDRAIDLEYEVTDTLNAVALGLREALATITDSAERVAVQKKLEKVDGLRRLWASDKGNIFG